MLPIGHEALVLNRGFLPVENLVAAQAGFGTRLGHRAVRGGAVRGGADRGEHFLTAAKKGSEDRKTSTDNAKVELGLSPDNSINVGVL